MSKPEPSFEITVSMTVNGQSVEAIVPARQHLADFVREQLQLTGTHIGCEHGVCGACAVLVDDKVVRGCLMLAVQAAGKEIKTIEGLSDSGELADLQDEFLNRNAAQCGFCTPGMLLTAHEFLEKKPEASRDEIREALSGNLCRCTGYQSIVDAVEASMKRRV